mmetsp:Transcript_21946/g.53089  ORF Transcript_21946/g.53089 Transcript_21946/m.53089 type:complete len:260 (-) Transcript_21946:476-1255(-)
MTSQTTECNDGLICENSAPCIPHPTKESRYMCDCNLAKGSNMGKDWYDQYNDLVKFAGVYCEHQATSYCHDVAVSTTSDHSFCTNGGECKAAVSWKEEHAGCKCPTGYEGDYCQFVRGSKPSDWELTDHMHPALANAYAYSGTQHANMVLGFVVGAGLGIVLFLCIAAIALNFGDVRGKLRRNEKESDTGARNSNGNIANTGVVSVGRQKMNTSTGHFVTSDTLEADGGVLMEALDNQGPSLEEVDLSDDKPTINGELA